MPCYSLSLAVLIGSEPHGLGFCGGLLKLGNQLLLVFGDFVDRSEAVVDVYAEAFLF